MFSTTAARDCLVLGAVGDALGGPVEFSRAETIEKRHGTEPPAQLAYDSDPPAEVTDDTQMTLFMAEGLWRAIEAGDADERSSFRQQLARSLVHWLATQDNRLLDDVDSGASRLLEVEALHEQRAPGNTCLSSCRHIYRTGELPDLDNRINDSKGCGAVMRSAPFAIAASSPRQAFDWARDSGVLTHCHPSGYLSAAYFASTLHQLGAGADLGEAMEVADEFLAAEPGADETVQAIERARSTVQDGVLTLQQLEELGEGWVGEEALAMAFAVAMTADVESQEGIRRALWLSVRHSGDSDSTGAITGNFIGAMAPPEAMPVDWIEQLEMLDVVEDCAKMLADASSSPS